MGDPKPGWRYEDSAGNEVPASEVVTEQLHPPLVLSLDDLAAAMDEAYEYVEDYVPALPFVDDHAGFWRPFAAKVAAILAREQK